MQLQSAGVRMKPTTPTNPEMARAKALDTAARLWWDSRTATDKRTDWPGQRPVHTTDAWYCLTGHERDSIIAELLKADEICAADPDYDEDTEAYYASGDDRFTNSFEESGF